MKTIAFSQLAISAISTLAFASLATQSAHAIEPQISVGLYQNLAVTSEGAVYAWRGPNPPTLVTGMRPVTAVAAGTRHNVALAENGFVYEWGYSPYQALQVAMEHPSLGECENKKTDAAASDGGNVPNPCAKEEKEREESARLDKPMRIPGVLPTKAVAASDDVTVILARNGEVYCWSNKQLVQRVPGLEDIKAVSLGAAHGIALRGDGAVLTWGRNTDGALGQTTPPTTVDPSICHDFNAQVVLKDAIAIGTGVSSSFAMQSGGQMWGWGLNTFHKDTNPRSYDAPRRIGTMSAAAELVGGSHHLFVRANDGKVFAWGSNEDFAIAQDDNSPYRASPADLAPLDNVVQLATYNRTLALTRDGYLCAWGSNESGQARWDSKLRAIPGPIPVMAVDGTTPFNLYTGKDVHEEAARICGMENWRERYAAWVDAEKERLIKQEQASVPQWEHEKAMAHKAGMKQNIGNGDSALIVAIRSNDNVAVKKLLALPEINVNAADSSGYTALMISIVVKNLDSCKLLLAAGAQRSAKTKNGLDAFMLAGFKGKEDFMKLLASATP